MSTLDSDQQAYIDKAKALVKALESEQEQEATRIIDDLASLRQSSLFQEIGKLTRELHNAMNNFRLDEKINELAEQDIPDAKERLNFVIQKTEEAADRTLTAMENSIPLCDEMKKKSDELKSEWARFTQREMKPGEFRELSKEVYGFLAYMVSESGNIKNNLNDAIMAQDFQDITGQIIKRVIRLVSDVEENLVNLLKVAGTHMVVDKRADIKGKEKLAGPVVPGLDDKKDSGTVSGQDEVDDLLASLGF